MWYYLCIAFQITLLPVQVLQLLLSAKRCSQFTQPYDTVRHHSNKNNCVMKIFWIIPLLILVLLSCEKDSNGDFEKQESEFVSTDVLVKTIAEYSIDKVFDFINSFDHEVENIKYGFYISSLPPDSLQYVLDYLNAKPYTHDGDMLYVTGYLHYQTNQITIFPKLFQIKNKEYQNDWLQSMQILQLTEKTDEEVSGNIIFFHVPAGQEKKWVDKFKTYDFVEWAELNHYIDINPWP